MNKFLSTMGACAFGAMSAAPATALPLGAFLPYAQATSAFPDLQTSLVPSLTVGSLDLSISGGVATLRADGVANDPTLSSASLGLGVPVFQYVPLAGEVYGLADVVMEFDVTFDVGGAVDAAFAPAAALGTSTNIGTTQQFKLFAETVLDAGNDPATPPGWTGSATDPILVGNLVAAGTDNGQIQLVWEVVGGRAAASYGPYAISLLSDGNFAVDANGNLNLAFNGGAPFAFGAVGMDTKPGQVVPLPPAGLALLAGLGALAFFRRRKAA